MSNFMNLNFKDLLKGFAVAVVMAILVSVYTAIEANQFPTTWAQWSIILLSGLGAGIAYLIKNFVTNSGDKMLKKEPK